MALALKVNDDDAKRTRTRFGKMEPFRICNWIFLNTTKQRWWSEDTFISSNFIVAVRTSFKDERKKCVIKSIYLKTVLLKNVNCSSWMFFTVQDNGTTLIAQRMISTGHGCLKLDRKRAETHFFPRIDREQKKNLSPKSAVDQKIRYRFRISNSFFSLSYSLSLSLSPLSLSLSLSKIMFHFPFPPRTHASFKWSGPFIPIVPLFFSFRPNPLGRVWFAAVRSHSWHKLRNW